MRNPRAVRSASSRLPSAADALGLAAVQSGCAGTPSCNSCSASNPSLLRPGSSVSSDGSACDRNLSAACRSGWWSASRHRRSTRPVSRPVWTGGASPDAPHNAAPSGYRTTSSTGAARIPRRDFQLSSSARPAGRAGRLRHGDLDRARASAYEQRQGAEAMPGIRRPRPWQEIRKEPGLAGHARSGAIRLAGHVGLGPSTVRERRHGTNGAASQPCALDADEAMAPRPRFSRRMGVARPRPRAAPVRPGARRRSPEESRASGRTGG